MLGAWSRIMPNKFPMQFGGTRWRRFTAFTANASPTLRLNMWGFKSCSSSPTGWNSKGTWREWASSVKHRPVSRTASGEGPTPVIRRNGAPPGLAAKACMKAGHCKMGELDVGASLVKDLIDLEDLQGVWRVGRVEGPIGGDGFG
nr:hypothetical protein VIGAN_08131300 [Ipomoea trifida]